MKGAGCRVALATGAAALIGALIPTMATADAPSPKSAAECRAISDFTLRGQCWDSLDKTTQQDVQATKKREFGLGVHLPSMSLKPKQEDVARQAKQEKEDVKSLVLTLADVENTPRGLLLMTATDGAVWEQTDGDSVPGDPVPGDTLKISKGFLGGYFCQVSRWQEVRCQRDR